MTLAPKKTEGKGKKVTFRRKKQQRNPRRLLESVKQDWARWDAAAKREGLNWSEFARRALNHASVNDVVVLCAYCDHGPTAHFPDVETQTRKACLMPGCDCERYQA